jgi:hypothetical protein
MVCYNKHDYYFEHSPLMLSFFRQNISETGSVFVIRCKGGKVLV